MLEIVSVCLCKDCESIQYTNSKQGLIRWSVQTGVSRHTKQKEEENRGATQLQNKLEGGEAAPGKCLKTQKYVLILWKIFFDV